MSTVPLCVQQGVGVVSLWVILCFFGHYWIRVGSSYPTSLSRVYRKGLRAILFVGVTACTMASLVVTTVVLLHFLALLLIMAGDVELNPGPGMGEFVHGRSGAIWCVWTVAWKFQGCVHVLMYLQPIVIFLQIIN